MAICGLRNMGFFLMLLALIQFALVSFMYHETNQVDFYGSGPEGHIKLNFYQFIGQEQKTQKIPEIGIEFQNIEKRFDIDLNQESLPTNHDLNWKKTLQIIQSYTFCF